MDEGALVLDVTDSRVRAFQVVHRPPDPGSPPAPETPRLIRPGRVIRPSTAPAAGPGEPLVVSSLGGAPLIAVGGLMKNISVDSARRAALSAGATVACRYALDDGRHRHDRAADLSARSIDALLLAGGVDEGLLDQGGGRQIARMAQDLASALPPPRGRPGAPLPVIFAGSEEVRRDLHRVFASRVEAGQARLSFAANVRPDMVRENHGETRASLLAVFAENPRHLVPSARSLPAGYLLWSAALLLSGREALDHVLVDLGRDAIEIHSVRGGVINRTVFDNLGRSEGSRPLLDDVRGAELAEWLPAGAGVSRCSDIAGRRLLGPSGAAASWSELLVDHALLRCRLARALADHRGAAIELYGLQRQRVGEVFQYVSGCGGESLIRKSAFDHLHLTGEELEGFATPLQAVAAAVDVMDLGGVTLLSVDTGNLLRPLMAAASEGHPEAEGAVERLFRPVAARVSPVAVGAFDRRDGRPVAHVRLVSTSAPPVEASVRYGRLDILTACPDRPADLAVTPAGRVDLGAGPGRAVRRHLEDGVDYLILDGRPAPPRRPRRPAPARALALWTAAGAYDNYPGDEIVWKA